MLKMKLFFIAMLFYLVLNDYDNNKTGVQIIVIIMWIRYEVLLCYCQV